MNIDRETINKLARKVGMVEAGSSSRVIFNDELERLVKLAAEHGASVEREACAMVCEERDDAYGTFTARDCAAAIRARGQA
jgi:hypothetical protein